MQHLNQYKVFQENLNQTIFSWHAIDPLNGKPFNNNNMIITYNKKCEQLMHSYL